MGKEKGFRKCTSGRRSTAPRESHCAFKNEIRSHWLTSSASRTARTRMSSATWAIAKATGTGRPSLRIRSRTGAASRSGERPGRRLAGAEAQDRLAEAMLGRRIHRPSQHHLEAHHAAVARHESEADAGSPAPRAVFPLLDRVTEQPALREEPGPVVGSEGQAKRGHVFEQAARPGVRRAHFCDIAVEDSRPRDAAAAWRQVGEPLVEKAALVFHGPGGEASHALAGLGRHHAEPPDVYGF